MFVTLQKLLVVGCDSTATGALAGPGVQAPERLGHIASHLLTLGTELRAEVPDPRDFLRITARATTEAALIVSPRDFEPGEAIDHLAGLQQVRLDQQRRRARGSWCRRSPEIHLARAFWQMCGIGLEVFTGNWSDGQIEEHAADLANYLFFTALTSGAWALAFRLGGSSCESSSPAPRPSRRRHQHGSPVPDSPGAGYLKGGCR